MSNFHCNICANTQEYTDQITLKCGHSFHSTCVAHWFWENPKCPTGRACKAPSEDESDDDESEVDSEEEREYEAEKLRTQILNKMLRRKTNDKLQAKIKVYKRQKEIVAEAKAKITKLYATLEKRRKDDFPRRAIARRQYIQYLNNIANQYRHDTTCLRKELRALESRHSSFLTKLTNTGDEIISFDV